MARVSIFHFIGGFAAIVAMYNVYSAIEREPYNNVLHVKNELEMKLEDTTAALQRSEQDRATLISKVTAMTEALEAVNKAAQERERAYRQKEKEMASEGQAVQEVPRIRRARAEQAQQAIMAVVSSDASSSNNNNAAAASIDTPLPCHEDANAEYWGDLVLSGTGNIQATASACCESCRKQAASAGAGVKKCNTWVWCADASGKECGGQPAHSCWLKWQAHPTISYSTAGRGPHVKWTSGSLHRDLGGANIQKGKSRAYHTIMTSNASKYTRWQSRIAYYWWKKAKAQDETETMGGFTRLLHSGVTDDLMDEIPTVVVDQLDNDHGFVVLSRPYAFIQWCKKYIDTIPEKYILMAEPDHIFLRPLPNLMRGDVPVAFPFFYIQPKDYKPIVRKFIGFQASDDEIDLMDPIGNSPNFINKYDLARMSEMWLNVSIAIKTDAEANKAWGWVLEMYGYSLTSHMYGLKHDLEPKLAAQTPWDKDLSTFYILHYTYGCDFDLEGNHTPGKVGPWHFDKRDYMARPLPRNLPLPPKGTPSATVQLIEMINEATASFPVWP